MSGSVVKIVFSCLLFFSNLFVFLMKSDDLVIRGMCQEALDMERSHGEEGAEGKCRKDKGHDLWYRPGPLAEFRRIPMRCLLYRSRQQQHLLPWLQTLCA